MSGTAPAGAAVLTLWVVALLHMLRHWPAKAGSHRRTRAADSETTVTVPLPCLLGPWSARHEPDWPEPAHGAAVTQALGDCRLCGRTTAGVLVAAGWRCTECHHTTKGNL